MTAFPEVLHDSCNTSTRVLPDMSTFALGHLAYIQDNALLPVLNLLNVTWLLKTSLLYKGAI